MLTYDEIGRSVRCLREFNNYTQEYIARKLSISQRAYSKIEKGEVKISTDKFLQLLEIYGVKINLLEKIAIQDFNQDRRTLVSNREQEMSNFYNEVDFLRAQILQQEDTIKQLTIAIIDLTKNKNKK